MLGKAITSPRELFIRKDEHDVCLTREVLLVEPCVHKHRKRKGGKLGEFLLLLLSACHATAGRWPPQYFPLVPVLSRLHPPGTNFFSTSSLHPALVFLIFFFIALASILLLSWPICWGSSGRGVVPTELCSFLLPLSDIFYFGLCRHLLVSYFIFSYNSKHCSFHASFCDSQLTLLTIC